MLSLVGLWYIGSWTMSERVLPGPYAVAAVLYEAMWSGEIWGDIGITLGRIVIAFSIAMVISATLGFTMGLSHGASVFFRVWIVSFITIPALVVMLTCYMVVGLNDTAAILGAAIPIIPILTINIRDGVKGIDPKLLGMAKAFRAGRHQQIFEVVAPQVAPILVASARFGLGLIWKMVLFAEVLGRGDGIGYKIEFYYQMFNMKEVLAHALSFLLVMLFIEVVILGTLEKRIFRWRSQ
ncbi:ABC transporter permease [Pseudorhodoplanes sinuspersici]|uniref:ABC transporter permease n=1 Tax=Pseudorhodoplanes sinuspersici TaxID=1235591 RepID=UPI0012FE6BB2|nr:ABC transporter permease subunit [Pseudorhodoplanes sinuspersici]